MRMRGTPFAVVLSHLLLLAVLPLGSVGLPIDPQDINNILPKVGSSSSTLFSFNCQFSSSLDNFTLDFGGESVPLENGEKYLCDVNFGTDRIGEANVFQSLESDEEGDFLYQSHEIDIWIGYTNFRMSFSNVGKLDQTENESGDGIIFFEGANKDFAPLTDITTEVCRDGRLSLRENDDGWVLTREFSIYGQIETLKDTKSMSLVLGLLIVFENAEDTKFSGLINYGLNGCQEERSKCCDALLALFEYEDSLANQQTPNAASENQSVLPFIAIAIAAVLIFISLSIFMYSRRKERNSNQRYAAILHPQKITE